MAPEEEEEEEEEEGKGTRGRRKERGKEGERRRESSDKLERSVNDGTPTEGAPPPPADKKNSQACFVHSFCSGGA